MITVLHIKNIGIIDEITINLNEGFNVLTGETGAGKTLIIDSLSIISGARFSKEMIRTGQEYSLVEACLYLPNCSNDEESNVVVSREIYLNGKNICKINGRLVTVNELKNFMLKHIDIHGQNDNQRIMDVKSHIEYLDNFCDEILEEKKSYQALYNEYLQIKKKLDSNYADEKEKQRTLDLLEYQINEIENADLKIGEEEELELDVKKIQNLEKISNCLNNSSSILRGTALDGIDEALGLLSKIESFGDEYSEKYSRLKDVYYEVEEIYKDLESLNEENYFDDEKADRLFKRMDLISGLRRKYGNTVEEILKYKSELAEKISFIKNNEEYVNNLKLKLQNIEKIMMEKAKELSSIRRKKSLVLESRINKELRDLEMNNAKFKVNIETEEKFNINGIDRAEFLVCTNVGEDFKPLVKIASGGEISRIMISIKTVISEKDMVETAIFDEVDTGISGSAAKSVGVKLSKIASRQQIICVTHSSIVAAAGDYHYFISKSSDSSNTKTQVGLLDSKKSLEEIARISSGVVNEMTIGYATELKNSLRNAV